MKKALYVLGALVVVGLLYFAYYALSPLFINVTVDEAFPGVQENVQLPEIDFTSAEEEDPTPIGPKVATSAGAKITETTAHPASGEARVVTVGEEQYLRYENFKTINGPDLYVYLATDLEATEFVDLGRLRATEGNVNYEIPPGTDLTKYRYALVWCKAFSVLFNSADLSSVLN